MTSRPATPERTCIGCRTKRPQAALVRVVVDGGGRAVLSRVAAGRGAWLCNPPAACLELARKRRGFDRAFRRSLSDGALDGLVAEATTMTMTAMAMAMTTAGAARDEQTKG